MAPYQNNHESLRDLVSSFQSSLLESDPPISGLDPTIVIDPRRLHITLGVMALDKEEEADTLNQEANSANPTTEPDPSATPADAPPAKKTVATALELLTSLKPRITSILSHTSSSSTSSAEAATRHSVQIPLNHLDVFPPGSTTGSSVLFLGPDLSSVAPQKGRRKGRGGETEITGEAPEGEKNVDVELKLLWEVAGKCFFSI